MKLKNEVQFEAGMDTYKLKFLAVELVGRVYSKIK